ncbi:MAG: sterol desaturase family protein [Solirubrobacteraceae bacterium]
MSADRVPSAYQAAITSDRSDLVSLRTCWREFRGHFSPRAVIAAVLVAGAARIAVGGWSWRDAIVPVIVLAEQPFVEWLIHKYLLHLPPFRLFGRRIELYGSIQHRNHHRDPSDLDRVLLKPVEVGSFVVQIAILVPLVVWATVALFGGSLLNLSLTALTLSYLGLLRYEWSHFLIHTPYRPLSRWYRNIWRNHRLHHFKHEGYWMGVSSTLGDRILGTNPDQRTVSRSPTARTLGVDTD